MAPSEPLNVLAAKTRQRLCSQVSQSVPATSQGLLDHLQQSLDRAYAVKDAQTTRSLLEAVTTFAASWHACVRTLFQRQLSSRAAAAPSGSNRNDVLELVSDEAVEDQLLISRLASVLQDTGGQALTDLRQRMIHALKLQELAPDDPVRPEVIARVMFNAWLEAGLTRDHWKALSTPLHRLVANATLDAYAQANRFLIDNGVMPEINLKAAVRKAPAGSVRIGPEAPSPSGHQGLPTIADGSPGFAQTQRLVSQAHLAGSVGAEWWTRARTQTQEVLGRLKRLFAEQVAPAPGQAVAAPSPRLQAMLQPAQQPVAGGPMAAGAGWSPQGPLPDMPVEQAVQWVRQRSTELKQATDSPSEKAIIEIVALMFQSILTEDRLPPSLRVWFARLQIPVLRVALAEPDFFSSLQHPARRLIDRLGSCALGFDANLSEVSAQALETEVKRIVQVIEQYPESGRRVFQLAHDEFQAFLTKHLQSQGQASRLVSVAQQVEQKETLTVQYTIELRKLLNDMPVRDDIRDFLFKIWAEVLAVATIKFDAKHEMMVTLKKTASDLLWAASAKPTRAERAQVIAQLPNLLARLRKGMSMLGMDTAAQDVEIKRLSDILADAFMSRTETIPADKLAEVTRNLSSLEDFLPQDGSVGDLDLDQDSIEMITGVDASNIRVITHGGQQPNEAMRAWAMELQLGAWFSLDHNGSVAQVQLAWRSHRGQLCLFATAQQQFFLVQSARVASYLQAGLLLPVEEESLTVRATRAALAKLDANPERLLH